MSSSTVATPRASRPSTMVSGPFRLGAETLQILVVGPVLLDPRAEEAFAYFGSKVKFWPLTDASAMSPFLGSVKIATPES